MAASSDAPHGPLLFPNSAKIFGISWDMQAVVGSLSKNFSLSSLFSSTMSMSMSLRLVLYRRLPLPSLTSKNCYCDFMYFGDLRFGGKDSHTSLYIILQVSKALTSALPLPSCFLWLQVWFAVSRYKSQIFKAGEPEPALSRPLWHAFGPSIIQEASWVAFVQVMAHASVARTRGPLREEQRSGEFASCVPGY